MVETGERIDQALIEGASDLTDEQRRDLRNRLMEQARLPIDADRNTFWGIAITGTIAGGLLTLAHMVNSPPFYESTDAQLAVQIAGTVLGPFLGGFVPARLAKTIQSLMTDKREGDIRDFLASEGIIR